jgi:hypothetical protein
MVLVGMALLTHAGGDLPFLLLRFRAVKLRQPPKGKPSGALFHWPLWRAARDPAGATDAAVAQPTVAFSALGNAMATDLVFLPWNRAGAMGQDFWFRVGVVALGLVPVVLTAIAVLRH